MIDHNQIKHDLDIKERILDYMDELDKMPQDVAPSEVRHRLRYILVRAEDALFEQRVNALFNR